MSILVNAMLRLGRSVFGPFRWLRKKMIYVLLAFEPRSSPKKSLPWLLQLSDDIGYLIDEQCIQMGEGVHIKHEIMTGIHSFFLDRIPRNVKVLDVGCGYGAVANAIAKRNDLSVVGIDYNEDQIAQAKKSYEKPNLKFYVGDATTDLPDQSFDAIVLSSLLEHVEDRVALLKSLASEYGPACILIRVPMLERHYHVALKKMLGLFAYTDKDHKIEYTMELFETEMRLACLQIDYREVRWGDIWAQCSVLSIEKKDDRSC